MLDDIPIVSHDGVTVAKDIVLKDKFKNIGALLVKEAAIKTNINVIVVKTGFL